MDETQEKSVTNRKFISKKNVFAYMCANCSDLHVVGLREDTKVKGGQEQHDYRKCQGRDLNRVIKPLAVSENIRILIINVELNFLIKNIDPTHSSVCSFFLFYIIFN